MRRLNKKARINLQKLLEKLTELQSYEIQKAKLRTDNTLQYAVERLFIQAGEMIGRFRDTSDACKQIFSKTPIFKTLKNFRNVLAHKNHDEIDTEIIISSFNEIKKIKSNAQNLLAENLSEDEISANFEMFGKKGNTTERQQYVDALVDNLQNEQGEDKLSFPKSEEMKGLSEATEAMLNHKDLLQLTRENSEISQEITHDIIKWAKNLSKKLVRNNPYEAEEILFEQANNLNLYEFERQFKTIMSNVQKHNPKLKFLFYQKTFNELNVSLEKTDDSKEKQNILEQKDALRANFLKNWSKVLLEKKLAHELALIDKARKKLTEELYRRIAEFQKLKSLLSPFTNDLGRLWDMSKGVWQKTGFDIVRKYAELLQHEKSLQELAELLGRFRQSEIEYEEELFEQTEIKQDWKIEHAHKSEFIGIKESNDLSAMLPSEVALLADVYTENIFMKKFAEKKLMTFDYHSRIRTTKEEKKEGKRQKAKETDKGPIIICVDTSGSMHGTPEQIAKVLCFAILKVALKDKRKCYLISFSIQIQTLELSDSPTSLDKLIAFLQRSFHGGTDATPAIKEAVRMLNTDNYKKSDVLLISDFIMPAFNESLRLEIEQAKANETKFHSLTISTNANKNVLNNFDNNWHYNPNNKNGLIDLVKDLKKMS